MYPFTHRLEEEPSGRPLKDFSRTSRDGHITNVPSRAVICTRAAQNRDVLTLVLDKHSNTACGVAAFFASELSYIKPSNPSPAYPHVPICTPFVTCEPPINRCTIAGNRRPFMGKVVRNTLSVVVSLVLFSVVALAQPGGNNANKAKSQEHRSRLAKLAFWRHHKNNDSKEKQGQPKPAHLKQAQANALHIKPSPAKRAADKTEQKQ